MERARKGHLVEAISNEDEERGFSTVDGSSAGSSATLRRHADTHPSYPHNDIPPTYRVAKTPMKTLTKRFDKKKAKSRKQR
jgi:hypothetical protein